MPLPPDYYNRPKAKTTPPAATGGGSSQVPKTVTAPDVIRGQTGQQIEQQSKRGFWSFAGEGLREIFTGSRPDWDQLSAADKSTEIFGGAARLGVDTIAALPKTIAKAVPSVVVAGTEAVEDIAHFASPALYGDKPKDRDFTLPVLGKISGYRTPYKEAVEAAGGEFASPGQKFLAAVQATGKVAGDVAITGSLVSSIRAAFSESLVKSSVEPGTGPDVRPKIQTRISKIKSAVTGEESASFKQNPNDSWIPAVVDGKPTNNFFRIRPLGDGTAEYTLYETKPALFKNPFAKGKVQETPFGPALPAKTGVVRYDESVTKSQPGTLATTSESTPSTEIAPFQDKNIIPEPQSRFKTGKELIQHIDYQGSGQVGVKLTAPELSQLANHIAEISNSDPALKAANDKWQGTIYKPYGGGRDIIIGVVPDYMSSSGTEFIVAADSGYGKGKVRSHATFIEDKNIIGKVDIQQLPGGISAEAVEVKPTKQVESGKPTDGIKFTSEKAKTQDTFNRVQSGQDIPSVMQPPLKGFTEASIEPKQLNQINYIGRERGFDPVALNNLSQAMHGKSLPDLTQKEAFDLAETVRQYNQPKESMPGEGDVSKIRPYIQPAKDLFQSIQDSPDLGYPLVDRVYNPIENGYRWQETFTQNLVKQANEVFGKYGNPSKFLEERRLIDAYTRGDKTKITENPNLTPEVKADLTKIGDWLVEHYSTARTDSNIASTKYAGEYAPNITQRGGIYGRYTTDELPDSMKQFFEFEREGQSNLLEDDALALFGIHAKAMGLNKFVKNAWEEAVQTMNTIPAEAPNIKAAVEKYLKSRAGYQGEMEKTLSRWGEKLSKLPVVGPALGPRILTQTFRTFISGLYAGTTGIPRLVPPLVNTLQLFTHGWASFGDKYFLQGIKNAATKVGREEFANSGFAMDVGAPYGGEIATRAKAGFFSRRMQNWEDLNRATLAPQAWADNGTRAAVFHMVKAEFEDNWAKFNEGKMTQEQFEAGINLDGYSPSIQNIVLNKLKQNTTESVSEALQTLARERIDDVIFPMRKASGTQMHQTLAGSTAGMFTKWPIHNANTLWNWAKRGQWQKLLKFYAATTALKRTFEDTFGIDMNRYLGIGSLPTPSPGPALNAIFQGIQQVIQTVDTNSQVAENNSTDLIKTLKLGGGAAFGLGEQRMSEFTRSVKAVEAGNLQNPTGDPLKRWPILTKKGNSVRAWVSFNDLLIYTFGGTPTSLTDVSKQSQQLIADMDKKAKQIDEVESYMNFGNFQKADALIEKYQIRAEWADKMKHNSLPTNQKLFERLPKELKEKWGPVLFPY